MTMWIFKRKPAPRQSEYALCSDFVTLVRRRMWEAAVAERLRNEAPLSPTERAVLAAQAVMRGAI
jgi:hypothetical protein